LPEKPSDKNESLDSVMKSKLFVEFSLDANLYFPKEIKNEFPKHERQIILL